MSANATGSAHEQKRARLTPPSAREPIHPGPHTKGQPYLVLGYTSQYDWLYGDQHSGARMDVTLWRPRPDGAAFIVGDYAQGNYSDPTGPTLVVTAVNDPDNTLLKPPTDYTLIWNDKGSGGTNDGSIWLPKPPDNYFSLGFVGQMGYDKPNIPNYRCVHNSLVEIGPVGNLIWKDQGSRASMDVSVFAVQMMQGIFVAQQNYEPFNGRCYQFKIN